ncbi:MAG: hypothetical protein ACRYGC_15280 [Janthinobacterium lividum]
MAYSSGAGPTTLGSDMVSAGAGNAILTGSTGSQAGFAGSGSASLAIGSGQLVADLLGGSAGGLLPLGGLVPGSGILQPQESFPDAIQGQTVSGGSTLFVLAGGTTPSLAGLATIPIAHPTLG